MTMRTFLIASVFGVTLQAAITPERIYADVRGVYLSTSPYCATYVEAFSVARAEFKDFLPGPSLGALDNSRGLSNGSYSCIAISLNEKIKFVPNVTGGNCQIDAEYSTGLCDSGTVTTSIGGVDSNCTSGAEDLVTLYFSTASSSATFGTGINPFAPPTATTLTNGLQMASAISVSGARTVEFVINGDGKIVSSGGNCVLQPPVFSIR